MPDNPRRSSEATAEDSGIRIGLSGKATPGMVFNANHCHPKLIGNGLQRLNDGLLLGVAFVVSGQTNRLKRIPDTESVSLTFADVLELRRLPDLLDQYNKSRPGQPPVSNLPPECISNRDQSPQLVSPLPNQSLAPRGKGECGMKTDGKEKERISTQFVVYGDGRKEQPFIIYHATEGPSDSLPKLCTVARELYDRVDKKGEEYPSDVLLGCNPNAYFYVRDLKRTIKEGMLNRPAVLIETADAYRCHSQIEYIDCCREHGIIPHPIGGGLTPVAQPLDSALNCIVHKTVRDENTVRMLRQPLNARGYPENG